MTNKKLKPRNLQSGIIKREVVNANGRVILTGMCALHSMGIGAKSLVEMFHDYAHSTVKQWRQNFDDGVFAAKFAKELDRIHITETELVPVIRKIIGKLPACSTTSTFTAELAMFCVHINRYYGYGKVRLQRMLNLMLEYDADCVKEIEKIGITFKGFDEYIFTEKETRKQKISNDELKRLAIGREAFRAVQEERKINDS